MEASPWGTYTLTLDASGYAGLERTLELSAAEVVDLGALTLGAGHALSGRVLRDGHPVAGSRYGVTQGSRQLGAGLTDGAGRFVFRGLAPGPAELHLADGSTHRVEVSGDATLPDLTLGATHARLEGRVVDADGRPLAGLTLTVSSVYGNHEAITDADGRFAFAELQPGRAALHAARGAHTLSPRALELAAGRSERLTLTAVAGGELRGQGAPAGERLRLLGPRRDDLPLPLEPTAVVADDAGRFSVSGLAPGDYHLSGRGVAPQTLTVRPGEVSQLALSAVAEGSLRVVLRGVHAPQRFLAAASAGEAPAGMAPGRAGVARLTNLPAGPVDVGVAVPGSHPQLFLKTQAEVVPNGEATVELRWPSPHETGTLHGRCLEAVAAGAGVQAQSPGADLYAEVGPDGHFELPGLPPGDYALVVSALDGPPLAVGAATVTAGARVEVTLTAQSD